MTPALSRLSTLDESTLAAIRDLLEDPGVAVPFFGRMATTEMIDRFLWTTPQRRPCSPDEFMLATGSDGTLLGVAGVHGGTLSFFVARSHWGQGIARALVTDLCARLDDSDHGATLTAMVYRENARSRTVVEAAGFTFAGLRDSGVGVYAGRAMLRYVRRPRIVASLMNHKERRDV
jgi:RimJ/RimL family protein N-acetyltransferase